MEKGYRTVQCGGCPKKLRIRVSEANYGKTLNIRCPECKTTGRVEIPVPAKVEPPRRPSKGNSDDSLKDIFGGNDDLLKDFFEGKGPFGKTF